MAKSEDWALLAMETEALRLVSEYKNYSILNGQGPRKESKRVVKDLSNFYLGTLRKGYNISKYGCVASGKVKFESQIPHKIRLISVAA